MKNRTIVFGGTGDVGQLIVNKLIEKGETVCVLTRQSKQTKSNLNYVVGNVLDFDTVEKIINKADKVVIALSIANSDPETTSKGTRNIISVMKKIGATRLICLSAQGSGDSRDSMPEDFNEMILSDKILSASFKDHDLQEELVKQSDLDWTIVRPTEIIADKETNTYTVNDPTANSKFRITNLDVAHFIVEELKAGKYIRQVAMITD